LSFAVAHRSFYCIWSCKEEDETDEGGRERRKKKVEAENLLRLMFNRRLNWGLMILGEIAE
jgi:hypothetical protein